MQRDHKTALALHCMRQQWRELKDLQDGQERAIQRFRQSLEAMIQSIVGAAAARPEEGAVEQHPVPDDPVERAR